MNDAATSQAEAARQSVTEAYRSQLPLLRDRLDGYWRSRAAELNSLGTPADFARIVKSGLADSVISPLYPAPTPRFNPNAETRPDLAAAQAQIRGLVRAKNN